MNANHTPINKANGHIANELFFNEAPASWNTRYISPEGFECQLTIRGQNGSEVLEKAVAALAYLQDHGCEPYVYGRKPNEYKPAASASEKSKPAAPAPTPVNSQDQETQQPDWCPIHHCQMRRRERQGIVWYSHKVNGTWCNGKAKK